MDSVSFVATSLLNILILVLVVVPLHKARNGVMEMEWGNIANKEHWTLEARARNGRLSTLLCSDVVNTAAWSDHVK